MRAKQVEDALFRANDKFDEVNKEKHQLAEELHRIVEKQAEERENWLAEKEKLEQNLRLVFSHKLVILVLNLGTSVS